jgi:uncharacterized ion transporter superfamily protein YfcC
VRNKEFLYLSDRLDILDERLDSVEKILALQEQNLSLHMRRTEILEQQVSPLNKFMYAAFGIIAFITFVGGSLGILELLK